MRPHFAVLAFILAFGCADRPEPLALCERLSCANADLVIETRFVDARGKTITRRLAPGDTFLIKWRLENPTDTATDTLSLLPIGQRRMDDDSTGVFSFTDVRRIAMAAHGAATFVDTLVVPQFTFANEFELTVRVNGEIAGATSGMLHVGDHSLALFSSGYRIEVLAMPTPVQSGTGSLIQIRQHTRAGALMRISNPYELPLEPIRVHGCFFDIDYCAIRDSSQLTPRLLPGAEAYFDFEFDVEFDGPLDWWVRVDRGFSICGERVHGPVCVVKQVRVLANFEAGCDVITITPGVLYADSVSECPITEPTHTVFRGSAFRFEASAGERYRIDSSIDVSESYIVPRDGLEWDQGSTPETIITQDGTHYVVLVHRQPVTFRLVRIQ